MDTAGPRADLLDAVFVMARHWPRLWQVPGVPEASATVVRCFRGGAESLTVGDVGRVLAVAPSTASRLVTAAARAGHVTKGRTVGEPRYVAVRLTGAGEDLLERLVDAERSAVAAATPSWTARQRWQARGLLLELAAGLAGDGTRDAGNGTVAEGPPAPSVTAAGGPQEGAAVSAG